MAGTHNTTSVTYSHPSTDTTEELGQSGEWWIRIEQVDAEELASDKTTLAEAADVVDAVYELEPCSDPGATAGGEAAPAEPPITQEEYSDLIDQKLDVPTCEQLEDGYREYLYVFRSNLSLPYELELSYGEVEETKHISETVEEFVVLNDEYQYSFSKPAFLPDYDTSTHPPFIEYLTKFYTAEGELENPVITISGSTINFEEPVTGSLKITYPSQYDIVTILMEESQDIVVRAFYHGLVVDTDIHPRILDELDIDDCLNNFQRKYTFNHDGGCYQIQDTESRCKCSGHVTLSDRKVVAASCKDGDPNGTYYDDDGLEYNYVDCQEKEELNSEDFYLETCCQSPDKPLPLCEESKEIFMGGVEIENGKDWWKAKYGPDTAFIGLGPRHQTHCGETTHRWLIDAEDCCGPGLPTLQFESKPDKVKEGESYTVCISGGAPPYEWDWSKGIKENGGGTNPEGHTCKNFSLTPCFCQNASLTVTDACDNSISATFDDEIIRWVKQGDWSPSSIYPFAANGFFLSSQQVHYGHLSEREVSRVEGRYGVGQWADTDWYETLGQGLGYQIPNGFGWAYYTDEYQDEKMTSTDPIVGVFTHYYFDGTQQRAENLHKYYKAGTWSYYKWECEYDELLYDEENSVEILADYSSGVVFWEGGKPPFTVIVSGSGVWANSDKNQVSVSGIEDSNHRIFSDNACGDITVTIYDDCSLTTQGTVKAEEGTWQNCKVFYVTTPNASGSITGKNNFTPDSYPAWCNAGGGGGNVGCFGWPNATIVGYSWYNDQWNQGEIILLGATCTGVFNSIVETLPSSAVVRDYTGTTGLPDEPAPGLSCSDSPCEYVC